MPNGLHDRAADNWRPLVAIADIVGTHWPDTARRTANKLSGGQREFSVNVELVGDIRTIFEKTESDRISSEQLCAELNDMDDRRWADWFEGRPLSKSQLARLLEPFDVRPRGIRVGEKTPRGYMRSDFEDAFARYLPCESATPQQSHETNDF